MMNQEEWEFTVILMGAAILATAVIVNDMFSLGKFWARRIRRKNPPTPEVLAQAHTRHQRFYHQTGLRLISITYISYYLFVLSFLGLLVIYGILILQNILGGGREDADELSLRLFYIVFFFLISRWYYRQEHHYITGHKLILILMGVLMIDFVHLLTHKEYLEVLFSLLILWLWTGGILRAILRYEVNYSRDIAYSLGLPCAALSVLFFPTSSGLLLILIPLFVFAAWEWVKGSESPFEIVKKYIPNQLPFLSRQPSTFVGDISQVLGVTRTFAGISPWEVLYWGLLTPVVLIPVTLYLQGREEQLVQYRDDIMEWAHNEYILDPETVADRFGLTLEDTYPFLNELVGDRKLQLYETLQGLRYGLLSSEEMDSFINRFGLHKIGLIQKDRDFLDYLWEKQRINPPKAILLSALNRSGSVEISTELVGGNISPMKTSLSIPADKVEEAAHDLSRRVEETLGTLGYFGKSELSAHMYLEKIKSAGNQLLGQLLPQSFQEELSMHHLVIETDMHDIPFELMCSDITFALHYAMGRRLRMRESGVPITPSGGKDVATSRALIIADPEDNLTAALRECDYLYDELDNLLDVHYLTGSMATVEAISACFQEGYSIIHYAGHAGPHGLQLADGELNSSNFHTCLRGRPLVFINGCNSAGANAQIAESFLRGGSIGYIGSVWEIHDISAARFAINFYSYTVQYTIGEALRMAKEKAFREENIAWLCFILFGDPTLSLI
jgi:hypothetical protein